MLTDLFEKLRRLEIGILAFRRAKRVSHQTEGGTVYSMHGPNLPWQKTAWEPKSSLIHNTVGYLN